MCFWFMAYFTGFTQICHSISLRLEIFYAQIEWNFWSIARLKLFIDEVYNLVMESFHKKEKYVCKIIVKTTRHIASF